MGSRVYSSKLPCDKDNVQEKKVYKCDLVFSFQTDGVDDLFALKRRRDTKPLSKMYNKIFYYKRKKANDSCANKYFKLIGDV